MSEHDQPLRGVSTRAVHAGDPRPRIGGALILPVFQSTVFEYDADRGDYHDILYPRLNNLPNHVAVADKLASLEGAEASLVAASGMAAISTTLLAVLGRGGHLLVQDQLYGGTHMLLDRYFAQFGLEYDYIDPERPESWPALVRPDTRAIYTETLTNPLLTLIDHHAVVGFAKENGLAAIIDNTFASPVNFRPLEHGYDLVVHSGTKYLNGHSDVSAGFVAGRASHVDAARRLLNELGGTLEPFGCYLLGRGMKTLALRVQCQNQSALRIARFLEEHSAVERVNYPGLDSHPQHARARELLDGFGGMLSFELAGGVDRARHFLDRLQLPLNGPSLGGVETLVTRPATTSHVGLTPAQRRNLGIGDGLVRMSVGIESTEDLLADLARALGG